MELCLIPVRTIRWLKCYQDLSGVGVVHRRKKIAIIQQTMEPGMTVSHVARLHGINANQIFKWRKQGTVAKVSDEAAFLSHSKALHFKKTLLTGRISPGGSP
nr:hypothetical protein [Escherichia coli]